MIVEQEDNPEIGKKLRIQEAISTGGELRCLI